MNSDKLAKLQEKVRIGGKGTPRRKMKKSPAPTGPSPAQIKNNKIAEEGNRMANSLAPLNACSFSPIDEVNMFHQDGHVIHFDKPSVNAAHVANTFVIGGLGTNKAMADLAPGILSQLGSRALDNLKRMAMAYQKQAQDAGISIEELARRAKDGEIDLDTNIGVHDNYDQEEEEGNDDEDIPELVESFEKAEVSEQ